ncbi:pyridoxine 5'-phosphate synthase [Helicobacter kayseriensis]|uniref:pyridoxine 5'-phosphate synthase n=1 Tax=Helicobacter kayseriensis TaxID=2905877 RepID=UPI001E41D05C|nr:pyridoxine 5'-phosphate synthase [Helicobacter kayseriensis]MCE3047756.1 pyridoxine 5'-phosphate synthase [Helicobacter kayseriensis]MCE3049145.1 pyridoxine 5'-phosphate synthase [Helicobacter kayseriensis]
MLLGVNIDHIATLREARKIHDPNPLEAVFILHNAGASQVTLHLREDRRHIHEEDLFHICANSPLPINLECACSPEIIDIVCSIKPHRVTLVPEKREEVTTEGGLNLSTPYLLQTINQLKAHDIDVSLFIDPTEEMIARSQSLQVDAVELHTGEWANLFAMAYTNLPRMHNTLKSFPQDRSILKAQLDACLENLKKCAEFASQSSLQVYAGHGLNYQNVIPIAQIPSITELNIGHSIIARSIFMGLFEATKEMIRLIQR